MEESCLLFKKKSTAFKLSVINEVNSTIHK